MTLSLLLQPATPSLLLLSKSDLTTVRNMAASLSLTCAGAVVQPAATWNQPCSDGHLSKIAKSISDWRAVSPFLGLTEAEESEILESTHSIPARKMAMLRKWKQKRGVKATYKGLCRVFGDCERADLVDEVKQLLAESNNSSDEEGTIMSECIIVPV